MLTAEEARALFEAIDHETDEQDSRVPKLAHEMTIAELRDRAIIGVMVFASARIGTVLGMDVKDYFPQGKGWWVRFHEKGGKEHELAAHHKVELYLDDYLPAAQIADQKATPLFRTLDRRRQFTGRRLQRREALAMVKRRARDAGLGEGTCNHSFRATSITVYMKNGGKLEVAQHMAAHESPRTTKLYDRTDEDVPLDEIERIQI